MSNGFLGGIGRDEDMWIWIVVIIIILIIICCCCGDHDRRC